MKRIFSFRGRLNRLSYFLCFLILTAVSLILKYVGDAIKPILNTNLLLGEFLTVCYLVIVVLVIWLWLAIDTQRMHDMGFSGWYLLGLLIPLVDIGIELMLLIKKGDDGQNKYGVDPLSIDPKIK